MLTKIIKFKKLIIAAIMMSLMGVGCSKDDDATKPTTNNDPFTFLKVGNELEYYNYYYDSDEIRDTMKFRINSENNGFFRVVQIFQEDLDEIPTATHYCYWYTNNNGWYMSFSFFPAEIGDTLYLPHNCFVGLKYKSFNFGTNFAEIISVSEKVTVPAGTFNNCIKVREYHPNDSTIVVDTYFHKDIGMLSGNSGKGIMKLHSKNF